MIEQYHCETFARSISLTIFNLKTGSFSKATGCYLKFKVISTTSGRLPMRTGGPQLPSPLDT
jgi:hypothetical protein